MSLIRVGALIGVCIILLDEILARTTRHMRVPPLAVGLGIYLPTQSTLMIVVGAIAGWLFDRRADRTPKPERQSNSAVTRIGLIVGESIIGVVISAIVVFSGKAHRSRWSGPAMKPPDYDRRRRLRRHRVPALPMDFANGAAA